MNGTADDVIDFDDAALERFLAEDAGGPVVMLNLLRFRPDGGRERYQEYVQQSSSTPASAATPC